MHMYGESMIRAFGSGYILFLSVMIHVCCYFQHKYRRYAIPLSDAEKVYADLQIHAHASRQDCSPKPYSLAWFPRTLHGRYIPAALLLVWARPPSR